MLLSKNNTIFILRKGFNRINFTHNLLMSSLESKTFLKLLFSISLKLKGLSNQWSNFLLGVCDSCSMISVCFCNYFSSLSLCLFHDLSLYQLSLCYNFIVFNLSFCIYWVYKSFCFGLPFTLNSLSLSFDTFDFFGFLHLSKLGSFFFIFSFF